VYLVTASEMRRCDEMTIHEHRVPGPVLMERAGRGIEQAILQRFGSLVRRRIWIVCGRGNNGGDGLVLARLLHDRGCNPRVLLTDPIESIRGDAALQVAPLQARGVALEPISAESCSELDRLEREDLLVDAVLGTGFAGTLHGEKERIVSAMNASAAHRIAVDIPSGLLADLGRVDGTAVRAELTVTMAYPKRSFLFWPARGYVGDWEVVDIGVPEEVAATVAPVARLLAAADVAERIRPFPRDAHKGTRGRILIAGGSPGLTGAVALAAFGAQRAGAGLVRVAVPESLNPILEAKLTEATSEPLAETDKGTLHPLLRDVLLEKAGAWVSLVLGPGMGRHPETDRLVHDLVAGWHGPIIVDADGLNALAETGVPRIKRGRVHPILTPHPGEMARLTGQSVGAITGDPIEAARGYALSHRVVLLLKGAPTVVSAPNGNVLVNTTGNPGLGTGGSGDVLSGIIGTFLAQGVEPWWAAGCAAFLHGLAADRLAERFGERAIFPSEVAAAIPEAWGVIEEARDA
jgi:NAD(P)H-hydrate epimerase